jgi:beta-lactamase regulating signal transducer with metallopeptidase domain
MVFVLAILSFAAGFLGWLLPGLVKVTYELVDWCQGFFASCLEYLDILMLMILWIGIALLLSGFVYGVVKGIVGLIKTRILIKRLPIIDKGDNVFVMRDDIHKMAFTHGIIRPRIYISTALIKGLDRSELNAVLLHEKHHITQRAPLKSFFTTLLRDTFFYIPIGGYLDDRLRLLREHEADDSAAQKSGSVLGLSSALLKLARQGREFDLGPQTVSISIKGTSSTEGRIRRLIEGIDVGIEPPSWRAIISSAIVTIVLILSLSIPLISSASTSRANCTEGRCEMHRANRVNN